MIRQFTITVGLGVVPASGRSLSFDLAYSTAPCVARRRQREDSPHKQVTGSNLLSSFPREVHYWPANNSIPQALQHERKKIAGYLSPLVRFM